MVKTIRLNLSSMTNKPYLSVIIPVYNKADLLPSTLIDIDKYLRKTGFEYEILIINDGSTDNTVEIVLKFEPVIQKLRLIDNNIHRGKGYAIRQGMQEAKGKLRLLMDADNSINIDHFSQMIPYFENESVIKYDIIIGSRFIQGSKLIPSPSFCNRLLNRFKNVFVRTLLLPNIQDPRCEFKCFSENAAKQIFNITKINSFTAGIETLAIGYKIGYKIKEIPVIYINNALQRDKLFSYCVVLWDVLKIKVRIWVNCYKINN